MDNPGDWLYIVFLIVAAISGLVSSGKKKQRSGQRMGQPERDIIPEHKKTQEKGFWEILEEMQQENPKPRQTPVQKVKPLPKEQARISKAPAPFLTAESSVAPMIQPTVSPEQKEKESNILSEISFSDPDELKKAVIYSEIFNRKY